VARVVTADHSGQGVIDSRRSLDTPGEASPPQKFSTFGRQSRENASVFGQIGGYYDLRAVG
jgi:hypothetical protein